MNASITRITCAFLYFLLVFLGVLYLYPIDSSLALVFNMFMLGLLCWWLKRDLGYKSILWFFLGFFFGVFGLAAALTARGKKENPD